MAGVSSLGAGIVLAAEAEKLKVQRSPVTGLATFVTAADGGVIPVEAAGGVAATLPSDFLEQYGHLVGAAPHNPFDLVAHGHGLGWGRLSEFRHKEASAGQEPNREGVDVATGGVIQHHCSLSPDLEVTIGILAYGPGLFFSLRILAAPRSTFTYLSVFGLRICTMSFF